jgi:amino acid adenylation domain-containing protein
MQVNFETEDNLPANPAKRQPLASTVHADNVARVTQGKEFFGHDCVHHLVEAQVERAPDRIAATRAGQTLSYAQLNARANQLARFLLELGAKPGMRIGIALRASLNLPVALLGVLKAGCTCLPLDLNYPKERLELMLEDAQPAALLTEAQLAPALSFSRTKLVCLDSQAADVFRGLQTNLGNCTTADSPAYVIYTSGSTGKPRGVLLPHGGLANHNQSAVMLYDLRPQDRVLQFSSISFDIAIEEIFPALTCGAAIVLKTDSFSLQAGEFLHWIEQHQVSVLDLPTAFWHELVHQLEASEGIALPGSLRLVILGGEKASTKAYQVWRRFARDRVRLVNTYGPTEASVIVTAFEPERFPEATLGDSLPLGYPVANAQIHLLDGDLKPVPPGVAGELHIGGPPLALGYLNQPELTAQKFVADPFSPDPSARLYKTGDLARCTADGTIDFLGRMDFQVKIRGFRVEPGEIEAALHQYSGLAAAVVLSQENGGGDKSLVAYVVWSAGQARASASELSDFLKQRLPEYMLPAAFVPLERLPLTVNGKVDRRALPKPELTPVSIPSSALPHDELQAQLIAIWQSVLGKKAIGIRDNFFEMGGHSLLAARLMHRIGQALGTTLPLAVLFQAPTIEKLSAALQQGGCSQYWSSLVPIQPSGSKPAFFCVHGVGGNVLNLRQLARHMRPDYPLYGLQAQGLDGKRPCLGSLEEMAAYYLKEIRTIQPQGPYFLGGYSLGGLIAYEMARQLSAKGEEAALVALLDTYPGKVKPASHSLLHLLRSPQRMFVDLPYAAVDSLRRRIKRGRIAQALKDVFRHNFAAGDRYVLQPYGGTVALFRAADKSWRNTGDPYAQWTSLAAQLEIHEIPGDHRGILYEPQVEHLAERLKVRMDEIRANYELQTAS